MSIKCWSKYLKGRDHLEDLGIEGRIILKWILKKYDVNVWTGFSWFRIGSVAGCCEHNNKIFRFHKSGYFWPAERLLASEVLSSMDLVN
jgi:hypothetical protein